jgi:hypothetical protein
MTTDAERLAKSRNELAGIYQGAKGSAENKGAERGWSSATIGLVEIEYRFDDIAKTLAKRDGEIATLRQERDEARAEVERLRAELERVISTAAIAVRGIMQRATPPSAPIDYPQVDVEKLVSELPSTDDVERAREIREAFENNLHPHIENFGDLYPLDVARRLALEAIDAIIGFMPAALTTAREQGEAKGRAESFAAALGKIAPKCNCGCIDTDYECVKCAVLKRAAASALAE